MSLELFIEHYQQIQEILNNNTFQEYGIIGLLGTSNFRLELILIFSPSRGTLILLSILFSLLLKILC